MRKHSDIAPVEISTRILTVRGHRVLLDSDLAVMYGVTTRRFNEQVRRNRDRFPIDFSFELTNQEVAILKSQFATSSLAAAGHGGRRKLPRVFTEHGAIMAATILNSPRAIQMSVYVVRAFVRFRKSLDTQTDLARELELLRRSVAKLDAETRRQFDQVYEAILGLMAVPVKKQ